MAAAAIIPAAIQAGTSIIGSLLGGSAAKRAAANYNRVAQAAGQAVYGATNAAVGGVNQAAMQGRSDIESGVQQGQDILGTQYNTVSNLFGDTRGNVNDIYAGLNAAVNPYQQAGATGLQQLAAATAPGGALTQQFQFGPGAYQASPGYGFQLAQGQQAIQRAAAARGAGGGAGTAKALAQFTTGLAAQDYQNAYNRALTTFGTNRANLVQNLGLNLGQGQFGTELGARLGTTQAGQLSSLAAGQAQATNPLIGAYAQMGYGGGLATSELGLNAADIAGRFGLGGTEAANQLYMQGAGAALGGAAAGSQATGNIFNSLGNLANALPWGKWFPGSNPMLGDVGITDIWGQMTPGSVPGSGVPAPPVG